MTIGLIFQNLVTNILPLTPSLDWWSITQASLQSLHVSIGLACISRLTIELGAGMVECLMQNWPIRLPQVGRSPCTPTNPNHNHMIVVGNQALCNAEERRGIVNMCKGEWSKLNISYPKRFCLLFPHH